MDSPYLESLLTAERAFPVRIPHRGEVQIGPARFFLMTTSNAMESTVALANRSFIVRLRKRPAGYQFVDWPEGGLLDGHSEAKARLSDPAQGFVRAIAVAVMATGGAGHEMTASELYELAKANDIRVPGLRPPDET